MADVPAATDPLALRRALYARFPFAAVAISVDGVDATLLGPLELGVAVGDLVVVDPGDGGSWVAQVRRLDLVEREVGEIEVDPEGTVGSVRARPVLRSVRGEAALLGRLERHRFLPSTGPVFGESPFRPATAAETATVLATGEGLRLGEVSGHAGVVAPLRAEGFARHTFLCGQSGSGKTYTTGVLLEELLLRTDLPMVVLDPNSDYVHLGEPADGAGGDDVERYRARAADVVVARSRDAGGDGPLLAVHLSDLPTAVQAGLAQLDPIADLDEYDALRRVSARLPVPYSVDDVLDAADADGDPAAHRLAARLRNLDAAEWSAWCRPGEETLAGSGVLTHRAVVVDLGSVTTPAEAALSSLMALLTLWSRRRERRPVLIVVDEAHHLFPAEGRDTVGRELVELGVRIAGEGRKFGLHLLLCTQRPDKLHPNVVSQCDNLVLLRVNSATDVERLVETFSHVPAGMIRRAPSFRQGEVLVAGPVAPIPRVLRTRARISREGGSDVPTDWAHPAG